MPTISLLFSSSNKKDIKFISIIIKIVHISHYIRYFGFHENNLHQQLIYRYISSKVVVEKVLLVVV